MHLEPRFVKSVSHYSEDILDQGKQVLLVEPLCNVGCFANVLKQLIKYV